MYLSLLRPLGCIRLRRRRSGNGRSSSRRSVQASALSLSRQEMWHGYLNRVFTGVAPVPQAGRTGSWRTAAAATLSSLGVIWFVDRLAGIVVVSPRNGERLPGGVTVTHQVLVLVFQVRILAG